MRNFKVIHLVFFLSIFFVSETFGEPNKNPAASKDSFGGENFSHLGKGNKNEKSKLYKTLREIPLSFEVNEGQTDEKVKFLSRGQGYSLFLTPNESVLILTKLGGETSYDPTDPKSFKKNLDPMDIESLAVRMKLVDSNSFPKVVGVDKIHKKSNYLIGNDPNKWHTNIPNFSKVKYEAVYPGIDLVYYGNQSRLEHDFVIKPGADYKKIQFVIEGTKELSLDERENLIISTEFGKLAQEAPIIFQEIDGKRIPVSGKYELLGKNKVGFLVAEYDASRPLIIDPVLVNLLDGSNDDFGQGIAVDHSGNTYVSGYTHSPDFEPPSHSSFTGGIDVFVVKFDSSLGNPLYSTFIGGSGRDLGYDLVVDDFGNVYITGVTESFNFPTGPSSNCPTGFPPFKSFHEGGHVWDTFVTKLSPDGKCLAFSTYLGGTGNDTSQGIALDNSGGFYVAGYTESSDFDVLNAFQASSAGGVDMFLTKFTTDGSLVYSTYFGGSGEDAIGSIGAIDVDPSGNAYVAGTTKSSASGFSPHVPIGNTCQNENNGGNDTFVAKFKSDGSGIEFFTFLGGNNTDSSAGIALDAAEHPDVHYVYVTGFTLSSDFPSSNNAFQNTLAGGADAFITKLKLEFDPAKGPCTIDYSTYLGGSGSEQGLMIGVDSSGNAYLTGFSKSTDFPLIKSDQSGHGGGWDVLIAMLSQNEILEFSSLWGGPSDDLGFGIDVADPGKAYVAGYTNLAGSFDVLILNPILPFSLDVVTQNAIDDLQDIIDNNPSSSVSDKLEDVIAKLGDALSELSKTPPDNQAALGNIEGAIGELEDAVEDGVIEVQAGVELMTLLANVSRQMVVDTLNEVQGGDPEVIADAQEALDEGDQARSDGDFKDTVAEYKDALSKAESLL